MLAVHISVTTMLHGSELFVPSDLFDESNPHNAAGSAAVRDSLVAIAAGETYAEEDFFRVGLANGEALSALERFANPGGQPYEYGSAAYSAQDMTELMESGMLPLPTSELLDAAPTTAAGTAAAAVSGGTRLWQRKRRLAHELSLAVSLRTRDMRVSPFLILCLGVAALAAGVPTSFWAVLSTMFVLQTKQTVRRFCKLVSAQLTRDPPDTNTSVRIVCLDNCDYPIKMTHQHANRDGFRKQTVNWFTRPLDQVQFPTPTVSRGAWRNGTSRFFSRQLFNPRRSEFRQYKKAVWQGFLAQASAGKDILKHPTVERRPTRTQIVYQKPVRNVSTAAYSDVDAATTAIANVLLLYTALVFLFGDQQTYSRLFWLKCYHPESNEWYIPMPGNWHFTVHALMAIHKLWHRCFTAKLVHEMGFEKTIKPTGWTSVELFVYYDRFYQLLVFCLVTYLTEVVPDPMLHDPEQLLESVRFNPTAVYAITFLYDFGLPWLMLRHGIRADRSEVTDIMWLLTLHWFRATKKHQYTHMAVRQSAMHCECLSFTFSLARQVYVTYFRYAVIDELADIMTQLSTVSMSGHPGRNAAYDLACEKQNRAFKGFLGDNPSDEQLDAAPDMLNAIRHIGPRFDAFIHGAYEEDEGSQFACFYSSLCPHASHQLHAPPTRH